MNNNIEGTILESIKEFFEAKYSKDSITVHPRILEVTKKHRQSARLSKATRYIITILNIHTDITLDIYSMLGTCWELTNENYSNEGYIIFICDDIMEANRRWNLLDLIRDI